MAFDLAGTLKSMADAARGVIAEDWPKVKGCVQQALKDQEDALKDIADASIEGGLTEEEIQSELDDEKKTFAAALLACDVKVKATAQKAANAAFQVLEQAIKAAL